MFAPLIAAAAVTIGEKVPQEPPVTGPPLVVSGSRVDEGNRGFVISSTVIERAQIESRQTFSVAELLRQVAGVHVIEQGGRGGFASALIRGGEPNFTAIYVDGVQVNDSTNSRGGSFDLSTLALGDIERIEVIRGSQSAVLGSGSLAGVINIVTGSVAGTTKLAVDASAGSDGYRRAGSTLSLPLGRLGLHASAFTEDDGEPVPGSRYEANGGRLAVSFALSDTASVHARAQRVDADAAGFPEDSGGPRLAVLRDVERRESDERRYSLSLRQAFGKRVNLTFGASNFERRELSNAPGIAPGAIDGIPPIAADTRFERDVLNGVLRVTPGPRVALALGAEVRQEAGDANGSIDFGFLIPTRFQIDRRVRSLFAEASVRPLTGLLVNAGLRFDDAGVEGSESTPRLGMRYDPGRGGLSLHANYSEGFKLPSFYALAFPLIANPDLRPERARTVSVGLDIAPAGSRHSGGVEVFRNRFTDLVDFDPQLFTNVNRSKVVTKGAEVHHRFQTRDGRIGIESFTAWLEADIIGSDRRLRGRPHLRAGTAVDWQARSDLSVRADLRYTDEVYESSIPTGLVALAAFVRADLALNWQASDVLRVSATVQNLFDESYEQAVGFPAPQRRLRLGLSASF